MNCEKCGAEMVSKIEGRNYVIECPNCKWGVVTTYTEPVYLDQTIYSISISSGNAVTKDTLSAIGKVGGFNYLQAKDVAENGRSALFTAKAPEVLEKGQILDRAGVTYTIQPEFPY